MTSILKNISDIIEDFLKEIINLSESGEIEVQRNALAEQFQCVPSQINYVISTRFSIDKGFLVESKRGGGGYIRIRKMVINSNLSFFHYLNSLIDDEISESNALNILIRLKEESFIKENEYDLLKAIIAREVIDMPLPIRDQIRANILKASLRIIFSKFKEGEK